MKNVIIDKYLQEGLIKEDKELVQEDYLTFMGLFAVVRLLLCSISMVFLYLYSVSIGSKCIKNDKLTKILNQITGGRFTVVIVPSDEINAFNMNGKTCYLYYGLYKLLNEKERIAILLHEASHGQDHDVLMQDLKTELTTILPASAVAYFLLLLGAFPLSFVFTFISLTVIYKLSRSFYSRIDEHKSDDFVTRNGYGKELASAFKKILSIAGMPDKKPQQSFVSRMINKVMTIFDSHPDIYDRIERAMREKDVYKKAKTQGMVPAVYSIMNTMNVNLTEQLKENSKIKNIFSKILNILTKEIKIIGK